MKYIIKTDFRFKTTLKLVFTQIKKVGSIILIKMSKKKVFFNNRLETKVYNLSVEEIIIKRENYYNIIMNLPLNIRYTNLQLIILFNTFLSSIFVYILIKKLCYL